MKKILLFACVLSAVLLLQKCKKDSFVASAISTDRLYAVINDTTWTPDTLSATITYNTALNTKVFAFTGMYLNKQINVLVTQNSATSTNSFPLSTFNVNSTTDVVMSYFNVQKNSSGNYVLTQQGTVGPGSGTLTVTAIDPVKKTITGTFSFTARNVTTVGGVTSVYVANVFTGAFNSMPYTFVSN